MSIYEESGGPSSYYTQAELDKRNNPEWAADQATYDAFVTAVDASAANRMAAASAAREALTGGAPSYVHARGPGGTQPGFSLAGTSALSSGGLSGRANSASVSGFGDGGDVAPVEYMGKGGMIGSPYAGSLGQPRALIQYAATPQVAQMQPPEHTGRRPSLESGIGGVFQQKMGGQPLNVYKDYLNQTYLGREQDALSRQVDEFVDLVDQAERAHFNAEESFGYGGGPSYQNLTSPMQQSAGLNRLIQANEFSPMFSGEHENEFSPMQPDISRLMGPK
jgi:hypothetical protein